MASRAELAHLDAIFAGCDAGIYTLPRRVLNARALMGRVEQAAADLTEPGDDEHAAFTHLADRIATGGDLDLEPVLAARVAHERHDLERRAYIQAAERAGDAIVTAVSELHDEIVHDHFAPAQAAIIEATRTAYETFSPIGSTPAELMSAPKAARDAYTRVDGLTREFSTLRQAVNRVRQITGVTPQNDNRGIFAVIHNVDEIWPAVLNHMNVANSATQPPWPDDDAGFLLYLGRPEVKTWCPTVAEQDARWYEVYGERVEQDRRNRANLAAYSSALGPTEKTGGLVGLPGRNGSAA